MSGPALKLIVRPNNNKKRDLFEPTTITLKMGILLLTNWTIGKDNVFLDTFFLLLLSRGDCKLIPQLTYIYPCLHSGLFQFKLEMYVNQFEFDLVTESLWGIIGMKMSWISNRMLVISSSKNLFISEEWDDQCDIFLDPPLPSLSCHIPLAQWSFMNQKCWSQGSAVLGHHDGKMKSPLEKETKEMRTRDS